MAFMEEKNSLKFNEVPVGSTFNVAREKPADRRAEYLQMSMEWQAVSSSSRGAHGVVGFVARFSARSENYPLEVLPHEGRPTVHGRAWHAENSIRPRLAQRRAGLWLLLAPAARLGTRGWHGEDARLCPCGRSDKPNLARVPNGDHDVKLC